MGLAVSQGLRPRKTCAGGELDGRRCLPSVDTPQDHGIVEHPTKLCTDRAQDLDATQSSSDLMQADVSPAAPTDAQILADLRSRLIELNLGISHLRGPLLRPNRLIEERYAIRRTLDSVVFYPILTIPPEIMQEIFLCCLPDDSDLSPLVPDPKIAPLVLLSVCRKWREIALSAPRLWTSIRVTLRSQCFDNSLPLLDCWLTRARSLPLSLAVVYMNYEESPSPELLIAALTRSSELWQDARLELPFKDLQRLNGIEGRVPLLRKLLIGPTDAYFAGMQGLRITPITAFSDAPLLREVHLVTGFPFTLELPWAQLTKLQATSLSVCECLEILEASPALVECTLSLRQSFDTAHARRIPPLEHLQVLTLRTSGFHADLLHCLTLPQLRELQFHVAPSVSSEDSLAKVTAFVERSGITCCLREIRFSGVVDLYGSQMVMDMVAHGTRLGPPLDFRRR
ncbi:hypothetical protein K438DRAFT_1853716 [Mycena galopus ATCC 62051]|nr:hypothetical protein K438DRAFT_1853716 [Mycena galopus ATCC 62051]